MVKIYALRHPLSLEIKYIGKTEKPLNLRLIAHIYESKRAKIKTYKHNWILKCISENIRPEIILLEECSFNEWQNCEKKWISYYGLKNLTNSTEGGIGGISKILTKEHREKIKKVLNEKIQNGEIDYKERAKKISKSSKGKKLSEITKQKLREINLGKKQSLECKLKKSKSVLQFTIIGEFVAEYSTLHEAAKAVNGSKGTLSSACLGKIRQFKGFKWQYKNKDIVQTQ